MLLNRFFLLLILCGNISFLSLTAQQRTCSTSDLHEQRMADDPVYRKNYLDRQEKFKKLALDRAEKTSFTLCPDPVLVPMAVHYSGAPANYDLQCLTDLALEQIQILNDDYQGLNADIVNWTNGASSNFPGVNYAESCIQFCLATLDHPNGYGLSDGDYAVTVNEITGSNSNWAGYINIFVRNIGALGFSPLGGNGNGDGVTIDNNAFGAGAGCAGFVPGAPYNLGRTLTHELGHYLNLPHIWGGGCSQDDGISDTPDQSSSNGGCPSNTASSCNSLDLHMNYMDYTNDACMYMFTAGQQVVMENYLAANLSNVTNNATVCVPPTPTIAFATTQSTVEEGTSSCVTAGTKTFDLEMTISNPPSANATVFLSATGSASNGSDFTISPAILNFPSGQDISQSFTVTIMEDGVIESNETFSITYTLNSNGGNTESGTTNQSHLVTINDDDQEPTAGTVAVQLINQDFNGGIAPFTVLNGGSNSETWKTQFDNSDNLDGTQYLISNSDAAGNNSTTNETLLSPVFNGSSLANLTLDFDQFIRIYDGGGDFNETFTVDIYDGNNWVNIFTHLESNGNLGAWGSPNHQTIDISNYAANNNQLRFVHTAEYDWWWVLDNIVVSGQQNIAPETTANALNGFSERTFGPFATLYFYDENTGNVMLKLTNNSAHNYGCTTVYIERGFGSEGAVPSNAPESEWVTEKTFRVVPEFNNPNGQYEISLYYAANEIAEWAATSGANPNSLQMVKSEEDIASASQLEIAPANQANFGVDFVYTATYGSGFSGFALGGAAPLPVEWLEVAAKEENNAIKVSWITLSEENNQGFAIMRRGPNERQFKQIGWIPGAGNSDFQQSYQLLDHSALAGLTYNYQIKQVDFDGKESYSPIVNASIKAHDLVAQVYPIPASDRLTLELNSSEAGQYQLITPNGILHTEGQFDLGYQRLSILTERTSSGIYWLKINTKSSQKILKVLVR